MIHELDSGRVKVIDSDGDELTGTIERDQHGEPVLYVNSRSATTIGVNLSGPDLRALAEKVDPQQDDGPDEVEPAGQMMIEVGADLTRVEKAIEDFVSGDPASRVWRSAMSGLMPLPEPPLTDRREGSLRKAVEIVGKPGGFTSVSTEGLLMVAAYLSGEVPLDGGDQASP